MEFRKKLSAVKALLGKGEDGTVNPIQAMMQSPENYRLEAYLEDGELIVKVKPKAPKEPSKQLVGYRLKKDI